MLSKVLFVFELYVHFFSQRPSYLFVLLTGAADTSVKETEKEYRRDEKTRRLQQQQQRDSYHQPQEAGIYCAPLLSNYMMAEV